MQFWKYKRILPKTQVNHPKDHDINELTSILKSSSVDSMIPTGYTYFGQLINHDLSFMDITDTAPETDSNGHPRRKVKSLIQRRQAALDLDNIYGAGLKDSHIPFDGKTGKFILGKPFKKEIPRDLPRQHNHVAQISDPRNDENMIIAQLQVLFMNFHNKVVDHYIDHGYRGGEQLFDMAKAEVIKTYVDLALHDFAKRLLPEKVYQTVIVQNRGLLSKANQKSPRLAVEFATAAFRLHSMVRKSYTIQPGTSKKLEELFRHTGRYAEANPDSKLFPLDDSMVIDWRMFFEVVDDEMLQPLTAKPISPLVSIFHRKKNTLQLHNTEGNNVDEEINLFVRSLLRGKELSLPTGQEALQFLNSNKGNPQVASDIGLKPLESDLLDKLGEDNKLHEHTPLWIYLMLEARGKELKQIPYTRLGELGGWLVADTLVAAARSVNLPGLQEWNPADSVIYHQCAGSADSGTPPQHISFRDLVLFTYPDDY